jgi:hypothetical protein
MIAAVAEFFAEFLIGWVPERQPWRALVVALYLLAAVASVAILTYIVITTL